MASDKSLILAINAGSSSLKISLFTLSKSDTEPVTLLLESSISGISSPPAKFSSKSVSSEAEASFEPIKDETVDSIKDHASAFAHFLAHVSKDAQIDKNHIAHICHRVVHGGDYADPVVINKEEYHHIEKLSDLAPLHNGAALSVIKACIDALPEANSIAFFDSAFHRTIPHHISSYAIDQKVAKEKGLKKYGFHGLSYSFILRSVAARLNKPATSLNLIILHLGSGASICAIKNGKSLDTSMGLTPLSGLPGATRAGDIDPSLIFHYSSAEDAGKMTHDKSMTKELHVTEAEDILNKHAGWKAIAGTTDFGEIIKKASPEISASASPETLAYHLFVDRILNYVGSYHLKLGARVDALVFSGGIGEKSVQLRKRVGKAVECLGYAPVDQGLNEGVGKDEQVVVELSGKSEEEGTKIFMCRTDEQLEMARQCALERKFWS